MLLRLRYVLMLPLLLLTLLFTPRAVSTDSACLVGQDVFVFDQAFVMGQGITTDGEYYYTSGSITALNLTALAKYTFNDPAPVLRRIDPALYGEFMGRMRPVMEEAGRNGLPRRKDLSAYQWALLRRFRKGDGPLLRAIAIEKGRWRSAYRLLLRLRYDGIAGTFRFIRGKKFTA